MKAKVRRIRKSWSEQLRKYESQGKILDGGNSYSKTDNDAYFHAHERRPYVERTTKTWI